jgi:hypothetical protein
MDEGDLVVSDANPSYVGFDRPKGLAMKSLTLAKASGSPGSIINRMSAPITVASQTVAGVVSRYSDQILAKLFRLVVYFRTTPPACPGNDTQCCSGKLTVT